MKLEIKDEKTYHNNDDRKLQDKGFFPPMHLDYEISYFFLFYTNNSW